MIGLGSLLLAARGATEPALSFISCTPDHGDAADVVSVTIVGTGYLSVTAIEVEPYIAGASFVIVDDEHITLDLDGPSLGASPGDSIDLRIIRTIGVDEIMATAAFVFDAAAFDVTTLPWSGLQLPVFSSLPHFGTASAGGSGSRKLVTTSTDPVVGEALNGITGVRYGRNPQVARFQTLAGADVTIGDLLTNSDYTLCLFGRIRSGGLRTAPLYKNSCFLGGDAHYNFGFQCDAQFAGNQALVFTAGANTIVRGSGDWTAEGFANGQTLHALGTAANDGNFGGATISTVTATTITMTGGVANETTSVGFGVNLSSGGKIDVMHYDAVVPFVGLPVPPPLTPGLHLIFVRHTGGHTQVDIDGVPGTNQVHADHTGSLAQQAARNYVTAAYVDRYIDWTEWMFATAPTAFSDADRANVTNYINRTYGTSYPEV